MPERLTKVLAPHILVIAIGLILTGFTLVLCDVMYKIRLANRYGVEIGNHGQVFIASSVETKIRNIENYPDQCILSADEELTNFFTVNLVRVENQKDPSYYMIPRGNFSTLNRCTCQEYCHVEYDDEGIIGRGCDSNFGSGRIHLSDCGELSNNQQFKLLSLANSNAMDLSKTTKFCAYIGAIYLSLVFGSGLIAPCMLNRNFSKKRGDLGGRKMTVFSGETAPRNKSTLETKNHVTQLNDRLSRNTKTGKHIVLESDKKSVVSKSKSQ